MKIDPIVATHQDAIRATWLIESMESTGTAFAIGNNLLLTCAHCVGDLKQKTVYEKVIANCSTYPPSDIRVKYIDWDRDIAVIELTQVNADHLMP